MQGKRNTSGASVRPSRKVRSLMLASDGFKQTTDRLGHGVGDDVIRALGHIVRGENISLVDGGRQKRAFTYIDDGIAALMKIIANQDSVATGKIYNIGNPDNNFTNRELAEMIPSHDRDYPEYTEIAGKVATDQTKSVS